MSHIALFNNKGELTQAIRCPFEELVHYSDYVFLGENEELVQDEYYIPNIQAPVKTKTPTRPTQYHSFNYDSKTWEITPEQLELAKTELKSVITDKMNIFKYLTITYDGKNVDANEVAQINISGKIAQLQNEIALGLMSTELFWKDADNVIHTWTDASIYLTWLQGLQVAIANRATQLYQASWVGKDAVDALTNIDDVINFDVYAVFTGI